MAENSRQPPIVTFHPNKPLVHSFISRALASQLNLHRSSQTHKNIFNAACLTQFSSFREILEGEIKFFAGNSKTNEELSRSVNRRAVPTLHSWNASGQPEQKQRIGLGIPWPQRDFSGSVRSIAIASLSCAFSSLGAWLALGTFARLLFKSFSVYKIATCTSIANYFIQTFCRD